MKIIKALSKQLFGSKYEDLWKSIFSSVIIFFSIYMTGLKITIAPFILYLTSTFFTAGIMWQMLAGKRKIETMQGIFMLPFNNHNFIFSYISALGIHTIITKTLPIWVLFFTITSWNLWLEKVIAIFCGCMICVVTAAWYHMCLKGHIALTIIWGSGIAIIILLVRQWAIVLVMAIISLLIAAVYLSSTNAYDFYSYATAKKTVQHTGHTGNVFTYLVRYLMANKNYIINTFCLCLIACFLPLMFSEFKDLNLFPTGLALLCLNTPICTLLSSNPDLDQAIRVLPRQIYQFCRIYCVFIFTINIIVNIIYLCSWQIIYGGIGIIHIVTVILFGLQSAIISVILEWKYPIHNWKTETDLCHHPRKYIVPLVMLLIAAIVGTYMIILWIWSVILLIECGILIYWIE